MGRKKKGKRDGATKPDGGDGRAAPVPTAAAPAVVAAVATPPALARDNSDNGSLRSDRQDPELSLIAVDPVTANATIPTTSASTSSPKRSQGNGSARTGGGAGLSAVNGGSSAGTASTANTTKKPLGKGSLVICRNKHWRFISAFHGPWLQMPVEVLETIAHINYNTPRPRPIDPAAFFDVVKIRRLVDEATNLAVRAASDVASPTLTSLHGSLLGHSGATNGLDGNGIYGYGYGSGGGLPGSGAGAAGGGGPGYRLSRERKFRMREQASQMLARAYRLDEIATSVATMQGASPIEDVASMVLARNGDDPDARYVHFFHEKIPSRRVAESTSLRSLDDLIGSRPGGSEGVAEFLRTRATLRVFKEDHDGAIADLTQALSSWRFSRRHGNGIGEAGARGGGGGAVHAGGDESRGGGGKILIQVLGGRKRIPDVILPAESQPGSLPGQLHFHRAMAHLTVACNHLQASLLPKPGKGAAAAEAAKSAAPVPEEAAAAANGNGAGLLPSPPSAASYSVRANGSTGTAGPDQPSMMLARKTVKLNARRAIRDLLAFLSQLEFSTEMPIRAIKDWTERINLALNGARNTRVTDPPLDTAPPPHAVYSLDVLFAAVPPADLPPYPDPEPISLHNWDPTELPTSSGVVTFHPLLTDALHSLLLCHCLAQTSTKELVRHAYMVARIVRLADGYPIFQGSRSPARSDWMEIIRKTDLRKQLVASWEILCMSTPLPVLDPPDEQETAMYKQLMESIGLGLGAEDGEILEEAEKQKMAGKERPGGGAGAAGADGGGRGDGNSSGIGFGTASSLPCPTAPARAPAPVPVQAPPEGPAAGGGQAQAGAQIQIDIQDEDFFPPGNPVMKRWCIEDGREYPILTERAMLMARWMREVPPHTTPGVKKRRKPGVAVNRKPVMTPAPARVDGNDGGGGAGGGGDVGKDESEGEGGDGGGGEGLNETGYEG